MKRAALAPMTYQGALDYLNSFTDYEKLSSIRIEPFTLERIERLLLLLGQPHRRGKVFHVAGTKGKGSTAAMLASVLQAQGYRTGFFTSPHLHSFLERIRVDGRMITEDELVSQVERLVPLVEELDRDRTLGPFTTFELTTALAFLHFAGHEAEYQVIEVGLGGRLDATNVVSPLLVVVTSISVDHTAILGSTLTEVAREKAGIIKPGSVVVSAPQSPEAEDVIRTTCREQGARLIMVGHDLSYRRLDANLEGQRVEVNTRHGKHVLKIPLLGKFQCENAAIAVAAIEEARLLGVQVSPESLTAGVERVSWPGRMQIIKRDPLILVDGAHNVHSASVLRDTIREDMTFEKCILVLGTSVDKDISGIARELGPLADVLVATRSVHPRSTPPAVIAEAFDPLCKDRRLAGDVSSAIELALSLASPADLVLVTGSLFVVAEALEWAAGALYH